ncbi:hypothetical protein [Anthocerotibacter panamensis]|uniref:hypothetical protein n=1 Tax=Anthocerotibacter panamensis TaxID=2857077 RepID=UPI001C403EE3|nr:hypothetical protein [Anthocerotibacter panamensis]
MEWIIAAGVAGLLTLFDLDRTFYVPAKAAKKFLLYCWWWGFIAANGLLAALLYVNIYDLEALKGFPLGVRALLVGSAYLAIIRAKFTTLPIAGKEVPVGIELVYEGAKTFIFKRINQIAKAARYEETNALALASKLEDLGRRAKLSIDQDALLSLEEKNSAGKWVLEVLQDQNSNDLEKRTALANYILSGQRID